MLSEFKGGTSLVSAHTVHLLFKIYYAAACWSLINYFKTFCNVDWMLLFYCCALKYHDYYSNKCALVRNKHVFPVLCG